MKKGFMALIGLLLLFVTVIPPVQAQELNAQEQKLIQIYEDIIKYHVSDVDADTVFKGAVEGMLGTLNDPHSNYFSSEEYHQFLDSLERKYTGVGMYVQQKDGAVTVQAPMDGSPAKEAGIKSGDQIIGVNGKSVVGETIEMVSAKIRGEAGTEVKIKVKRQGEKKPLTFTVVREKIQLQVLESKMLQDHIGYIRLFSFSQSAAGKFAQNLKDLKKQGMESLVLDLRSNPGGLLDSALSILENFIEEGPLVRVVNSKGHEETYVAEGKAWNMPIAVLINKGSASASEIVTGALRDYDKAVIVGMNSFGKGTVQTLFPLQAGGVLKLTIQEYFTPLNKKINGVGIQPDIVQSDELKQLAAAVQFLRQENVLSLKHEGKVSWNGSEVRNQQETAFRQNGQWYISLRKLADFFDGTVSWNNETKIISLKIGDSQHEFNSDHDSALILSEGSSYIGVESMKKMYPDLFIKQMNGDWYISNF